MAGNSHSGALMAALRSWTSRPAMSSSSSSLALLWRGCLSAPTGAFWRSPPVRRRVWDCRARNFATRELRHPAVLDALTFNPQGDRLATACRDSQCRVYAISQESVEPSFAVPHVSKRPIVVPGAKVTLPLFVADGRCLVTRSERDLLWWHADGGALIRSVPREYMDRLSLLPLDADVEVKNRSVPLLDNAGVALTSSPDGRYLAVGEGRAGLGIAQLFEAATGASCSPASTAISLLPSPSAQTAGGYSSVAQIVVRNSVACQRANSSARP